MHTQLMHQWKQVMLFLFLSPQYDVDVDDYGRNGYKRDDLEDV